MLAIDPNFVTTFVNTFYGGGEQKVTEKNSFSDMEKRMHERVSNELLAALSHSWASFEDFELHISGRDNNPVYADFTGMNDLVLCQPFKFTFSNGQVFLLEILYTLDAVRYLEALTAPSSGENTGSSDPTWQYELHKAIHEVRVPVRSVLARLTMTLPRLAELKTGDIIPIPTARNLPLIIGGQVFARGNLGEKDGCAAYQIEKLEQRSEL